MFAEIMTYVLAIFAIYLYGSMLNLLIKIIFVGSHEKTKPNLNKKIRDKAKLLINTDTRVKKIYVSLRILYLKNKSETPEFQFLEQQLRIAVREKAVRQEILYMIRAKASVS